MPSATVNISDRQEFSDADWRAVATGDQSKKVKFDLSGLSANTTKVITAAGVTWLDSPTSANLAALLSDELGPAGNVLFGTAGTFTVTASFATPGNSSWSYGTRVGVYMRFGDWVAILIDVAVTPTIGTGSGALQFDGIPYTAGQSAVLASGDSSSALTFPAGRTMLSGLVASGGSTLTVRATGSGVSPNSVTASNMTSGSAHTFRFTGLMKI